VSISTWLPHALPVPISQSRPLTALYRIQMSSEGPIDRLLRGINTANLELMHGAFAADAEIVDDAKSFTGDNIRAFLDIAMIQHHANIRVVERQLQDDGRTYLHIMMDGDFVEGFGIHEPFDLYLVFHVVGDKIHRLDMGDVDPNKPTMRCVYGAGADMNDPLASLRIAPRNLPEPREGWVRVQMQAVGLNFHDIFTLRGISLHKLRFPLILGNEGAGILDDGTEVALYPTLGSPDFKDDETLDPDRSVLGELAPGTLAEYVMVPKRNAVPRPKEVSAQSAAVLGIAWLTAYRMLFTRAHLRAGQVMLVQGSSGGKHMRRSVCGQVEDSADTRTRRDDSTDSNGLRGRLSRVGDGSHRG